MSLFKSTKQHEICPECSAPLQIKRGKQGLFLGCSRYPECNYLKPLQQSSHVIKTLDECCPECQSPLQLKQGHFGIFIGCSNYPVCQFVVHDEPEIAEEFDCPACRKHKLVVRSGRSGKAFYACSGYPECKFTLPNKPVKIACPQCQCELAVQKKSRGKRVYQCANRHCHHIFTLETE